MGKKQLDTVQIANELQGSSFFQQPGTPVTPPAAQATSSPHEVPPPPLPQPVPHEQPSRTPARQQAPVPASEKASTVASTLADDRDIIEAIRKVVKHVGKDPLFVRVTEREKRQIQDIAYSYNTQGITTTDNQLCRIAINYMLEDYQANGKQSILALVLEALNA
jgi:hypothetical protein